MERWGRERHGRAAHLGERAGVNESNILQIFHFHGAGPPQVGVPNFSGLTPASREFMGAAFSPCLDEMARRISCYCGKRYQAPARNSGTELGCDVLGMFR